MKQMFKNSLMLLILEINLIGIILLRQFLEHFFLFDIFFSLLTLNTQNIFFCCFFLNLYIQSLCKKIKYCSGKQLLGYITACIIYNKKKKDIGKETEE